jgi:hypothetical protein
MNEKENEIKNEIHEIKNVKDKRNFITPYRPNISEILKQKLFNFKTLSYTIILSGVFIYYMNRQKISPQWKEYLEIQEKRNEEKRILLKKE